MTGRRRTEDSGAGAGARAGLLARSRALELEHAALCGLVARACATLRLDWSRASGGTDTQRRMSALRAWMDGRAGSVVG